MDAIASDECNVYPCPPDVYPCPPVTEGVSIDVWDEVYKPCIKDNLPNERDRHEEDKEWPENTNNTSEQQHSNKTTKASTKTKDSQDQKRKKGKGRTTKQKHDQEKKEKQIIMNMNTAIQKLGVGCDCFDTNDMEIINKLQLVQQGHGEHIRHKEAKNNERCFTAVKNAYHKHTKKFHYKIDGMDVCFNCYSLISKFKPWKLKDYQRHVIAGEIPQMDRSPREVVGEKESLITAWLESYGKQCGDP